MKLPQKIVLSLLIFCALVSQIAFAQETPKARKAKEKLQMYQIPYTADAFVDHVEKKNYEVVQRFIDAGFDVNSRNSHGEVALIVAAQKGSIKMLELLDKNKADLNATDIDGSTALMYAAHFRQSKTVKFLVKKGADVNQQNNSKMTALMYAVLGGCIDSIDEVITKDTDISLKNVQGKTAISLARDEGFIAVANFIKSKLDYLNHRQEKQKVEYEIQLKRSRSN